MSCKILSLNPGLCFSHICFPEFPLPITHRAPIHPYKISLHIEILEANPGIFLVDVLCQEVLGGDGHGPWHPFQKARVGSYAPLPPPTATLLPKSLEPKHLLLLAVDAD